MSARALPNEKTIAIAALEAAADRIEAEGKEVVPGAWIGTSEVSGQEGAARLGVDAGDLEVDVDEIDFDWLTDQLQEDAFDAETLLQVSKEPRGGMLSYNLSILAVPLRSGRRRVRSALGLR